jgi:hypothetical protein
MEQNTSDTRTAAQIIADLAAVLDRFAAIAREVAGEDVQAPAAPLAQ